MHWGQIKTLLILSFFVLDIYLFTQFMEKKEVSDIAVLEHQSSTIEEQLSAESITVKNLPDKDYEETFISVKQKRFSEEELKAFPDQRKQKTFIFHHDLIASTIDNPIKINKDDSTEEITNKFKETVYYSDEYTFWGWNKDVNIIIFFQNKMNRPVYYNQNGIALFYLNDDNEVEYYTQTMLGEAEAISEKQKLIKPMRAIEELYDGNKLFSGDEITGVNIGFHTRIPFESGVQVFAPVWKVNVNGDKDYFVNAIEGFNFSSSEVEFLQEVIRNNLEKMQVKRKKNSPIDKMVEDMRDREDVMKGNEVKS